MAALRDLVNQKMVPRIDKLLDRLSPDSSIQNESGYIESTRVCGLRWKPIRRRHELEVALIVPIGNHVHVYASQTILRMVRQSLGVSYDVIVTGKEGERMLCIQKW